MDLFTDQAEQLPFSLPEGDDYGAKWNDALCGYEISIPHGELFYCEAFLDRKLSDDFFEYLLENDSIDVGDANWKELSLNELESIRFANINWQQDEIKMFGKTLPLPRLTAWYGDKGAAYTYSGITSHPNEWNNGLLQIKNEIERRASAAFNSVLLNWYRDGEDHMGWHADDEKELGLNPTIASMNFGEARDFFIRLKSDKTKKLRFQLNRGSLLMMKGELQHFWEHSLPKRKKVQGSRINLTFRNIK